MEDLTTQPEKIDLVELEKYLLKDSKCFVGKDEITITPTEKIDYLSQSISDNILKKIEKTEKGLNALSRFHENDMLALKKDKKIPEYIKKRIEKNEFEQKDINKLDEKVQSNIMALNYYQNFFKQDYSDLQKQNKQYQNMLLKLIQARNKALEVKIKNEKTLDKKTNWQSKDTSTQQRYR